MSRLTLVLLSLSIVLIIGCSSRQENPVSVAPDLMGVSDAIPVMDSDTGNHELWGMWEVEFDVENLTYEIRPVRELNGHLNITTLVPAPGINIISYDPATKILNVDVTLNNPYSISGYDVRLILYYYASNSAFLTNDDDWTTLYDIAGGYPFNPFKAYAKGVANRKFNAFTQHTEKLLIYLPYGAPPVKFAIDASYPSNCTEPYSIDNFQQGLLESRLGDDAELKLDVYDWQNDVSAVNISIKAITGDEFSPFMPYSGTEWRTTITNATGAPAGTYYAPIWAASTGSGTLVLYEVVTVVVTRVITWPATWGGTGVDYGYAIEIDDYGKVYVGGGFTGSVDFDPGPGVVTKHSSGQMDAFLSKLDSDGNLLWVKTWGGWEGNDTVQGITFDSSDNIYVTGYFNGTVDFDPGTGVDNQTSNGLDDVYISKFNDKGDHAFTKTWGSQSNYDKGLAVSVDGFDYLYVTGWFSGSVDFDPSTGVDVHVANGIYRDVFLSRFNSNGDFQWAGTWGGTDWDEGRAVIGDQYGNAYITGYFRLTSDFDPDDTGILEYTSQGMDDCFLSKFDSSGDLKWAKVWGGASPDSSNGITMLNWTHIYTAGTFLGTVDFDPDLVGEWILTAETSPDAFFTLFDPDGEHGVAYGWGGASSVTAYDITLDSNARIVVAGSYSGDGDFDPTPGVEDIIPTYGQNDCFVTQFTIQGFYQWTSAWGGVLSDMIYSIAPDSSGNTYSCGYFMATPDFDPGDGILQKPSNGITDVFVNKLDSNGNIVTAP